MEVGVKFGFFLRSVSISFFGVAAHMIVPYVKWKQQQQQCVLYQKSRQLLGLVVLGVFLYNT